MKLYVYNENPYIFVLARCEAEARRLIEKHFSSWIDETTTEYYKNAPLKVYEGSVAHIIWADLCDYDIEEG